MKGKVGCRARRRISWERAAKLADGGNGDVNEAMLSEDLFTDQTASLLNLVSNVGTDGSSGQKRLHDRLFVRLDRGVRRLLARITQRNHKSVFPSSNSLSI